MAYTTYAEVLAATGTALPQATVETLIGQADREIDSYLAKFGITADGSSVSIISASLALSICNVLTRYRMDGTKESSTLEYSDKTPVDTAIATYRTAAYKTLDQFAKSHSGLIIGEVVFQ
jgi:hypothetical protein